MSLDLAVVNGTVIDGTGGPRYHADVGVQRGRIAAITRSGGLTAARLIDASGLVVAPGFIDIDSHADWAVAQADPTPLLARWLRQGVTTVVGGACGFSPAPVLRGRADVVARLGAFLSDAPIVPRWRSFAGFLEVVDATPLPLNVGFLVGQNTLRAQVAGSGRSATADAVRLMVEETREALRAGALGLSANAAFVPGVFASAAELRILAETVARDGGLFAVHARAYTRVSTGYPPSAAGATHGVRAIHDLAELARATGARLHVFHLMVVGRRSWRTCDAVLGCVDAARRDGVDLAFDAAPYHVAVGPLQLLFPPSFVAGFGPDGGTRGVRALKLLSALQRVLLGMRSDDVRLCGGADPSLAALRGCTFTEIARRLRTSAVEAQVEVARRVGMNGASVLVATASGDEGDEGPLRAILAHPLCAVATNAASLRDGPQNPSVTGAFPRVLGRLVRDEGAMSLEDAVRRMTALPATRLGLRDRGEIAEGSWADLAVFSPEDVGDATDPERPDAVPRGIAAVLVSGVPVFERGVRVEGAFPGRVLRRSG